MWSSFLYSEKFINTCPLLPFYTMEYFNKKFILINLNVINLKKN